MTTSKGASQYNKLNWEESDFPIVCETCFGDNPFMRMTKDRYGKECGVCLRPFTVFRWQSDKEGKFRSTEICQVCTRTKNVCQSCIMDLEYGLPVQVRDKFLNIEQNLPTAPVNLEYNQQLIERQIELSGDISAPYQNFVAPGKATNNTIRMLAKLAHSEPYSKNKPNICTFFVKGECKRGEECPYRHEKPSDPFDPINEQHIKDRYYGVDDNVAQKIIDKYDAMPKLSHPEDRSITTIELDGLPLGYEQRDVIGYFYQFGEVRRVQRRCGGGSCPSGGGASRWAVQFAARESAEKAAQLVHDWAQLGHAWQVTWAAGGGGEGAHCCGGDAGAVETGHGAGQLGLAAPIPPPAATALASVLSKPKLLPPLPQARPQRSPAPSTEAAPLSQMAMGASPLAIYPSQDPHRLGNKIH